jgi:trehalose 6-phosphate synthase
MSLVVVSNRLPVVVRKQSFGGLDVEAGTGGLVTALRPVLQHRGGTWIGWAGESASDEEATRRLLEGMGRRDGYDLVPVTLPDDERRGFYEAFANEAIWPLFHDLNTLARFRPEAWTLAQRVNRRFAAKVLERVKPDDLVWVHDYHLIGAARAMKEAGFTGRIAFFLHIPFPPLDLFLKLPWRSEVLSALLAYDLVGVQTMRDRANLLQCVRALIPDAEIHGKGTTTSVVLDGRVIRVGAFPIGIDVEEFATGAREPGVIRKAESIRRDEPGRTILLSVDRLDYTKGLTHRLDAFGTMLERLPELRGRVTLMQFVIPSRGGLAPYAELKRELERRVGELNGRFTPLGMGPGASQLPGDPTREAPRLLPRRRRRARHPAQGRDEPRLQGVLRVPRGRGRRARPLGVRRGRGPARPRRAPGEPVGRRRVRRRDRTRGAHVGGRETGENAQAAARRAGARRIVVGRRVPPRGLFPRGAGRAGRGAAWPTCRLSTTASLAISTPQL